jgi:hypothetical protein
MARRRGGSPVKSGARSASTHASWLTQVEIWFSILAGKSLKGASFQAVEELRTHIDAFIKRLQCKSEAFRLDQVKSPSKTPQTMCH